MDFMISRNNFDSRDIVENKKMAAWGYLGILFFIPLIKRPNSPVCRYTANQGLLLFLLTVVANVVFNIFSSIRFLRWIFNTIMYVYNAAVTIVVILALVNLLSNNKVSEFPFIGKYRIIK